MVFGTVVKSDTDEDGNAIAVVLETYEGTYSIDQRGAGAELLSYVGRTVEIEGVITENEDGWRQVEVLSFGDIPDFV